MVPAPAVLYCTPSDLDAILSQVGEADRYDDDNSGVLEANEVAVRNTFIAWATARVNMKTAHLYDKQDMGNSVWVNYVTAVIAAYMTCGRRTNPVPATLAQWYKEAMADLDLVHKAQLAIDDIGYRDVAWPAWSNIRSDPSYRLKQARVERKISEQSPTPYIQARDISGEQIVDVYP